MHRLLPAIVAASLLAAPSFSTQLETGTDGLEQAEKAADVEAIPARPQRTVRDRDGNPLPFPDEVSILSFLARAPIESKKPIGVGVTGALEVTLAQGAVRVRSAFHDIDEKKIMATVQGKPIPFFLDSYRAQVAAYELSKMFGLDTIPPATLRSIGGNRGSIQLWIEGASDWDDYKAGDWKPADPAYMQRQLAEMWVWDELIHNIDRNQGNIIFDADDYLWWIDHTRAFAQDKELFKPERIKRCSRRLLRAMRELDGDEAYRQLGELLSKVEIKAMMARRDKVVKRLDELIAERGEVAVLFTFRQVRPVSE